MSQSFPLDCHCSISDSRLVCPTSSLLRKIILEESATTKTRVNLQIPVVLWLALRNTGQKQIHDAMPFGRDRKTTMQALSIQQMRCGFVMYTHGEAHTGESPDRNHGVKELVLHVSTFSTAFDPHQ